MPVSHVSPEDSTSNGNPQDCGAEIDDAVVSLIAQNLYNSSFQCDYPSYYDPEMGLANIFKGDSSFGTINSLNDLKSQVEEYLEILNLGWNLEKGKGKRWEKAGIYILIILITQ